VGGVVAAVGQEQVGPFAAAASQQRDCVDDRDRAAAVVLVRRPDQRR
jgi:hypothetical protein